MKRGTPAVFSHARYACLNTPAMTMLGLEPGDRLLTAYSLEEGLIYLIAPDKPSDGAPITKMGGVRGLQSCLRIMKMSTDKTKHPIQRAGYRTEHGLCLAVIKKP